MLSLIDDMCAAAAAQGTEAAMQRCWTIQREQLEAAQRWPYRPLAKAAGGLYALTVVLGGVIARLACRRRPDRLIRTLAALYYAVPELILHKAIELRSLIDRPYAGRGLDLGCGDGQVGGILIEEAHLAQLDGVDISGIDEATILSRGYAAYSVADMRKLPHPDASYDYAVSICVVEHVPNLRAVLAEAARVLRPGGALYLTTPMVSWSEALFFARLCALFGFSEKLRRFRKFRDIMLMHYNYLSAGEWRELLGGTGFVEIDIRPIFSRRELLAYDLLNLQTYFLRFYFYDHLARWTKRWPRLRQLMSWSAAELCAALESRPPGWNNATHYSIACRRA